MNHTFVDFLTFQFFSTYNFFMTELLETWTRSDVIDKEQAARTVQVRLPHPGNVYFR